MRSYFDLLKAIGAIVLVLFLGDAKAQEEEIGAAKEAQLIPFTGMDYVRVVFDKSKIKSVSGNFKAIIKSADSRVLWQGAVTPAKAINEGGQYVSFTIKNLRPQLWSPSHPVLYELTLQQLNNGVIITSKKERVGFRSFERRGGNLYLNDKPVFLRGIAINPPGRGIPDSVERSREFALEYVKFMKSINVNIIRIPDAEEWYDVCDELGMMVFGGNYSGKVAGGEKVQSQSKIGDETDGGFPTDYDKGLAWFENEKLGAIAHHPSLMIYAMTNETPFSGERATLWEKFLDYAYKKLKQWDETRVYIANAGYGYGKTGDITDIHRYWGWYYSSPFTFLHLRNEVEINPYAGKHQPLTFTECVGNYTGPDGRYNLTPAHKNPSSQLAWTGHAPWNVQSQLADAHQSFTLRQATETFRQLRSANPDLCGVFPFTILFYNWNTIAKFADMHPKPVTEQVRISYQPVLLSWECWTPNVYAGTTLHPIAHIINDDDNFNDLKNLNLVFELKDKAQQIVYSDSVSIPDISYYGTAKKLLSIKIPYGIVTGTYQLFGRLMSRGKLVSQNFYNLFIADSNFVPSANANSLPVLLYDKTGGTRASLTKLGLKFSELLSLDRIPTASVLIIAENSANEEVSSNVSAITNFIEAGGRILCLRQDSFHLEKINLLLKSPLVNNRVDIDDPVYPVTSKAPRNGYYVNLERPDHPVFSGITRENLRVWSDYTGWDETKPGFPAIQPVTDGFMLHDQNAVANTAILANYSSGLQAIALAERFQGKGSVILCGLDLISRAAIDPVADRVLINLINYSASSVGHERYPVITSPIIWGEYQTEKGIVTDLYSGLLVNATPRVPKDYLGKGIVVTKEGYQLAGGVRSGFNTKPGIQYVANGRRPFGPYAQTFGGQPVPEKGSTEGIGKFWCRIAEGQNSATSLIWNPSDEPLTITIKINDLPEVTRTVGAGEKLFIDTPVDTANVGMVYKGDRRLVILETSFSKKQ